MFSPNESHTIVLETTEAYWNPQKRTFTTSAIRVPATRPEPSRANRAQSTSATMNAINSTTIAAAMAGITHDGGPGAACGGPKGPPGGPPGRPTPCGPC